MAVICLLTAAGVPTQAADPVETQSQSAASSPEVVLPKPLEPFTGQIGRTTAQSKPAWPKPVTAPVGAPNIVLIMTDDVGFGAAGTFGGPIPTPNLDRLAATGLKYNEFHTTALCSPTRAALLTGRNHHQVASGMLVDSATGYPGYWSMMPRSAATIGEVLKDNGYSTAFFGKHHNVPNAQASVAGPFDLWPTGLGFEYFFGFIGGDTDQWSPKLYRGTDPVDARTLDSTQPLDHALADDAIRWIHNQKANAPDKPFMLYYAPGSTHAPHQAPAEWITRFRGKFDRGWDQVREETFRRQKAMRIIPAGTDLTPRPKELPAWDSLAPSEKAVYARYMEVYAGMMAYQDAQIGRILDELARMRELDNTLVIFIEGDNGASGEGGLQGTTNEIGSLANKVASDPAVLATKLDTMGGPHSYEVYPAGWGWAMDTPFQWMKQIASHFGGTRNAMVVSWPAHIKTRGELRSQFGHVIDIYPTLLQAAGIQAPTIVDGVRQQPVDGISLMYSFDRANTPERHQTQYFEMIGNRAMYQDGWIASTTPRRMPWSQVTPTGDTITDYQWELYDLRHDYSQAHNLAAIQPEKLKQLQDLWLTEAQRNKVFPVDDSFGSGRSRQAILAGMSRRTDFTYWGKDISVGERIQPTFAGRSFSVTATVTLPSTDVTGVMLATGSWFGGWSFYFKDGRPVAYEAFSENPGEQYRVAATEKLPTGQAVIRYDFDYDGGGLGLGGLMRISVDGKEVARGRIERTITATAGSGETFDIGLDSGVPVSDEYEREGRFPGDIAKIEVHLGAFALKSALEKALDGAKSGSE
jgi:arylsulfatase A-like enzyme